MSKEKIEEIEDQLWLIKAAIARREGFVGDEQVEEFFSNLKKQIEPIVKGDRVRVNNSAGFSRGSLGTAEYVTPTGEIWVMRDGATSAVYFMRSELEKIK